MKTQAAPHRPIPGVSMHAIHHRVCTVSRSLSRALLRVNNQATFSPLLVRPGSYHKLWVAQLGHALSYAPSPARGTCSLPAILLAA